MKLDKYIYYQNLKSVLESNDFIVNEYEEINFGLQFIIIYNDKELLVRIYESKKKGVRCDLSQVRDKDVKGLIEKLINEYNIIDPQFKPKKPGKIEYPQTLIVLEQDIKEEIIKFLKKEGAEKEDSIQEYIEYFYSIYGLKITFFSSGKILFQGKSTTETDNVFETIKKIITQEHRKEFENKIEQYFDNDEDFSKYIEESECENYISSPGEEYLGKELFNFLNLNDQVDLLDAISLYEFSKKGSIKFNNYAILVRNFAIVDRLY